MNNSKISCVPHARRLFIPAANSSRLNQRARFNTFRSKRQPVFRAALKSPAPSDLGTPTSLVSAPPLYTDTTPLHSSHLAVLSHLAELEALLCSSSPALELLHQLREEVATCFQSPLEEIIDEDILEYDRGHNFGTRNTIGSSFGSAPNLDLDFDLGSRYAHLTAELSTLPLDEAKDKLYALSTQGYDDTKSKFDSLKSLFVSKVRRCADVALPNIPTSPNISVLLMVMPDLHTRLDEVWAALRKDVSFAVDRLVLLVANLVGDGDGDVSWEDARWKGLISHPEPRAEVDKGNERGYKVDMHTLALEKSQGGDKLIRYRHLPERWRNNEFVWEGYRFIPGKRWPALVLSMFQLHNETVNIQTHFVPLLSILFVTLPWELTVTRHPFFSGLPSLSLFSVSPLGFTPLPPSPADPMPKFFYLLAAGACLACSAIWHTLAGCSDLWLFEAGARIDYVGIGWLISASVSGVVYYGFACQPAIMRFYISIAIMTGIAGSILPFQAWFDERKNKVHVPLQILTAWCKLTSTPPHELTMAARLDEPNKPEMAHRLFLILCRLGSSSFGASVV